jgi:hypothetical protein
MFQSLLVASSALLLLAWSPAAAQEVVDPLGGDEGSVSDLGSTPAPATSAGLVGRVVTAQRCPVPVAGLGRGRTCPDLPLATFVQILTPDGQQLASVQTTADGDFSVDLSPGQYQVEPLLADGSAPIGDPILVNVPTTVTVRIMGGTAIRVP